MVARRYLLRPISVVAQHRHPSSSSNNTPVAIRCLSQSKDTKSKQPDTSTKTMKSTTSTAAATTNPSPVVDSTTSSSTTESSLPSSSSSSTSSFWESIQGQFEESSGLIELSQLKQAVQEASEKFDHAVTHVAKSRDAVAHAQAAHDQAHKKHVSLLMRREEWNADDAQAFVTITADEVTTRQALVNAQDALKHAENHAIQRQHNYMDVMRQRYHEEQLWQDKWRLLGTYGTWSLIGINTMVFLGGQYATWRRERYRLDYIEQLILDNSNNSSSNENKSNPQQLAREQETAEETLVMAEDMGDSTDKTESADDNNAPDQTPDSGDETTASPQQSRSLVKFFNWTDEEMTVVVEGVPLHLPSMAVGAAASASIFVIVSLLFSRR